MSAEPLISVVIPVYNSAECLKLLVSALRQQTYKNLEIVFCDDASTDGLGDYFERLRAEGVFSCVQFLKNESNRGVSFSRNRGIAAARGEYVITVDADDLVEPGFVSALFHAISGGADYSCCGYKRYDESTGKYEPHPLKVPAGAACEDLLIGRMLNTCEISHCTTLFKREFLSRNDLKYHEGCTAGEDMEFLLKMLTCNGRGAFVSECLYTYVQHESMGSHANVVDPAKKFRRYHEHTEAQFREAFWIIENSTSARARKIAASMMLPAAWQRRLSEKAMQGDRAAFDALRRSESVVSALKDSWRSFPCKPEVWLRSCAIRFFPGLYYRSYSRYCKK